MVNVLIAMQLRSLMSRIKMRAKCCVLLTEVDVCCTRSSIKRLCLPPNYELRDSNTIPVYYSVSLKQFVFCLIIAVTTGD